jgi:hypothetical protein
MAQAARRDETEGYRDYLLGWKRPPEVRKGESIYLTVANWVNSSSFGS